MLTLKVLYLPEVEEKREVGKDLLKEGDSIRADLGFLSKDFDFIKKST